MPEISIIVPVYKVEKYLRRCVDSILAQTFTDFELLLIDDGSPDNSGKICDEYAALDPRIRVFHKPNGGVSSARNLGIDNARGEWIAFVDSDDWIEKYFLDALYPFCDEGADMAVCGFNEVSDGGSKSYLFQNFGDGKDGIVNQLLISYCGTSLCLRLIKKSLFEKGRLRCPVGIAYCEDFNLSAKLMIEARKIVIVDKCLYNYYQRSESVCHNIEYRHIEDGLKMNDDFVCFLRSKDCLDKYQRSMCWRYISLTQDLLMDRKNHKRMVDVYPAKNREIWGCPLFYNKRHKILYWMTAYHMSSIVGAWLGLRNLYHKAFRKQ